MPLVTKWASVKKITNSDLLAAITNKNEADINISQVKKVRITEDPSAVRICLTDEELCINFPL